MPHVEFACEGRILFRADSPDGAAVIPRIHEVMIVDETPYQVVDVEYWARPVGTTERRVLAPTVYLSPLSSAAWQERQARRAPAPVEPSPPVRY